MENTRQKIAEIITATWKTPLEQADEILLLFNVSGQLKCDACGIETDAGTKLFLCESCGQEHPKHFNLR